MTRPRVLLIDDDGDAGPMLQSALEMRGFDARWANALPAAEGGIDPVDIIVLDLNMPGVDGFMTIDRIASDHRSARIVIASGQSARIINAAAQSATRAGLTVIGSLEKPYIVADLVKLLEQSDTVVRQDRDETSAVMNLLSSERLEDRVQVFYQSKRDLESNTLAGYEALVRVLLPTPISPEALFASDVPLTAKVELTILIVQKVAADWATFHATGQVVPIAVNCPPCVLCDERFLASMRSLAEAGIMPTGMLELELTEHPSTEQLYQIARAASQLAMLGFTIAIDDFGRGSTSLEKLTILPVLHVKLDRETFWETVDGTLASSILQEVVRFCKSHGIATTVEGIETEKHRQHAIDLGATFGQGYLWDRPQPLDAKVRLQSL